MVISGGLPSQRKPGKDWNSMNMEPKDLQTTTPAEPAVRPETGPSRRERLWRGLRKLLRGKKRKAVALLLVVAIPYLKMNFREEG